MTFILENNLDISAWVGVIIDMHAQSIPLWKNNGILLDHAGGLGLAEANHSFNHQLWYAEDRARRSDLGSDFVMQAKRAIDQHNQNRNDRVEQLDTWLFNQLNPSTKNTCSVHSETPGMMIDRLSILALKSYNMGLQTQRLEVSPEHRDACLDKLNVINAQRDQLQQCLVQLLQEVQQHTRTFRVYHQFKMYNHTHLNPELYLQEQA